MISVKSTAQEARGSGWQEAAEDHVAQKRHIKAMKSEYTKVHKNLVLVEELMDITSCEQGKEINNEVNKIKDVVERYPFVQNNEKVILVHEMYWYIYTAKFSHP